MFDLNLPFYPLKEIERGGCRMVFDDLRGRYVVLTAEERVRQLFVHFLIERKHYPMGLIANELSLNINGVKKRCDTVVFNKGLIPVMIVEYKAPRVEITRKTFEQALRYNFALHVDYLVLTNGLRHFCCVIDYKVGRYRFLSSVPDCSELGVE